MAVGCAEKEMRVHDNGEVELAVDQKLRVKKGRSQVQCQVTERSNWNKCDDVNRSSQRESATRKKR